MNKTTKLLFLSTLMCLALPMSIEKHENHNHLHVLNNEISLKKRKQYEENKQEYLDENGKQHTIYWAQGITPPKMPSNRQDLGKPGYFELDSSTPDYLTLQAAFVEGNNWFDYNKDLDNRPNEHALCYLASSSNIISWWLVQNKQYIDEYRHLLETTDIYGNEDGLRPTLPYNSKTWDDMYKQAPSGISQGYIQPLIGDSALIRNYLGVYYRKTDDGYFPDRVFDYFVNGYEAISNSGDTNSTSNFVKDPTGGFFYNIFGKELLTFRDQNVTYEHQKNNIKEKLNTGYGLNLAYLQNNNAHALTIWGADYDENGDLVRIYVSDSDDNGNNLIHDSEKARGMVGMNIRNDHGIIRITNASNPNILGAQLNGIYSFDLAEDKWAAALADKKDPEMPIINEISGDKTIALTGNYSIVVNASKTDNGVLDYKWYKSSIKGEKGELIKNQNKNSLKVDTSKEGITYYTVDVLNRKHGKKTINTSNQIKIEVKDIPLVNAQTPSIRIYWDNTKGVPQYSKKFMRCDANIQDGGTLSYQWYQTDFSSITSNPRKLKGETRPELLIDTSRESRSFYYCEVTNTNYGENITGQNVVKATPPNSYTVKVTPSTLENTPEAVILSQNNMYEVDEGSDVNLSFLAKSYDGGKLSYQWYEINDSGEEVLIPNEISNELNLLKVKPGTHKYVCYITNRNENATGNKESKTKTNEFVVQVGGTYIPSNDATLRTLLVENATLSPKFDPSILNYETSVHVNVSKLNVTATPNDSKAKVTITNPNLVSGNNTISISVKAENGDTKVYTITVLKGDSHNYGEVIVDKAPTCTETGIGHKICSVCGDTIEVVIEATGHKWEEEFTIDKQPTCTEFGEKSIHCSECDARKDITQIDKLEHEYGEVIVDKEPTCTEPGTGHKVCKNCGDVIEVTIPAKGHTWEEEFTIDKEPTLTEEGEKSIHCSECDARKDITSIPKLEPTPDPEGPENPEPDVPDNPETPEKPETSDKNNDSTQDMVVIIAAVAGSAIAFAIIVGLIAFIKRK